VRERRRWSEEEEGEEELEGCAAVCISAAGELGVRRERVEGFAGSGFFVDDLKAGWYHVAAVATIASGTRFVVNGRGVGASTARAVGRLRRLGSRLPPHDPKRALTDECWGGRLADVRLFDRALDADDVGILFAGGPFAAAAAHAPQLPPKHERAKRAARARLAEAAGLLDDAALALDAALDKLRASCLDALPDLLDLVDAVQATRDDLDRRARDACLRHNVARAPVDDIRDLLPSPPDLDAADLFLVYVPRDPAETETPPRVDDLPLVIADAALAAAVQPAHTPALLVCDAATGAVLHRDALPDLAALGPLAAKNAWTRLRPSHDT